jgi:hypothetical protein
MGHLLRGSGLGHRKAGRLSRQRQMLVMQAVATHVGSREVNPYGQQRQAPCRVGHVQPGQHLAGTTTTSLPRTSVMGPLALDRPFC